MLFAGLCSLLAASLPAQALPPGGTTLHVWWQPTSNPLSYVLEARAYDPDGRIHHLEVCVDGKCAARVDEGSDDLQTCIDGGSASAIIEHTFEEHGTYEITARATGGGCLGLFESTTAERSWQLQTQEPPPPPDPDPIVPCSGEGETSASDVGVDANWVYLASEQESYGSPNHAAINGAQAAIRAVNASGGVCGRRLSMTTRNNSLGDGDEAVRQRLGENFFALVGLDFDLDDVAPEITASGMPAIGTGARSSVETNAPGVYPVGSSPFSQSRVLIDANEDIGASNFVVVYESQEPFATRTAETLQSEVESRPGLSVVLHPITGGQASYSANILQFNNMCDAGLCDAVIYLLHGTTFRTWIAGRPSSATVQTNLWPRLMEESIGRNCGTPCNGMFLWSGFEIPTGTSSPAAETYKSRLLAVSPTADSTDQDAEFAYAAVMLTAMAIGRAGPDLTREAVRSILDTETVDLGLNGGPLSWSTNRDANHWLRSYRIVIAQGSFAGFAPEGGWRSGQS